MMMGDNKSEKFFKVLHDRMKEARTDIKATVSVNVGEMTHKANEKELEQGETSTSQLTRSNCSFCWMLLFEMCPVKSVTVKQNQQKCLRTSSLLSV